MCVSSRTSIISAHFQRLSHVVKKFPRFAVIMSIQQKFSWNISQQMYLILPATQNWIKFPSRIPIVEQLFCRTARWVLLLTSALFNLQDDNVVVMLQ